jgi:hypothetical protein
MKIEELKEIYKLNTGCMTIVKVLDTESTIMGEMADIVLDNSIQPTTGMILMDEDSQTWEVTGALHDTKRLTEEGHARRWTLRCKPVNTEKPIHRGEFKLIH